MLFVFSCLIIDSGNYRVHGVSDRRTQWLLASPQSLLFDKVFDTLTVCVSNFMFGLFFVQQYVNAIWHKCTAADDSQFQAYQEELILL